MVEKKAIAIITARGGSKRIPRKNIKNFCGKPIISYSIDAALKSDVFDEVMVSTEDREIAEIARLYGANVPFFRSDKTANDYATTRDVILEVIESYKKMGITYQFICCIYPTAPFITDEKLIQGMKLIEQSNIHQVMPVVEYSFPPQRCNIINSQGFLEYKFPEYKKTRSQDLSKWYHDVGQFYFYNAEFYLHGDEKKKSIYPIIVSELEAQDIDNETDWRLAEMKYKLLKEREV